MRECACRSYHSNIDGRMEFKYLGQHLGWVFLRPMCEPVVGDRRIFARHREKERTRSSFAPHLRLRGALPAFCYMTLIASLKVVGSK